MLRKYLYGLMSTCYYLLACVHVRNATECTVLLVMSMTCLSMAVQDHSAE
ncbi:unnamed protein product [Gemmata massiliana]|uniref:Uncharacterized protein n=1 Tax=Gemmata massiliana TaxID=1210884 RepID=A0A6P2CY66_9BACT|nr:unnamed protein product [Gemmata massiliana]